MLRAQTLKRAVVLISITAVTVLSACTPAGPSPTSPPDTSKSGTLKEVPRNRTLIYAQNGPENKWADYNNWNPYAIGTQNGYGTNVVFEPLAFYNVLGDEETLWLAESYEFSPDYMELTIKIRPNVTWSDGEPFTAEDVAYTLTTLGELGPKVQWGADVQTYVAEATASDPLTVDIQFKVPAPRFFWFLTYKVDNGVYIVPKHIFEGQDWTSFTNFDLEKGWPVTTGPWEVVLGSPEQKIWDRRDQWWAVDAGVVEALPGPERLVLLPFGDSDQGAQAVQNNEVDHTRVTVQNAQVVLDANPNTTTHSGNEPPYGYLDWWPYGLFLNNTVPPFDNPDVRWALSYFIDREKLIEVAFDGYSTQSSLPMPPYPGLDPYFDEVADLLEEYDTNEFNPEKGAALLMENGWTKGEDGFWVDSNGERLQLDILSFSFLQSVPPIVAELLKQQGVDATFSMPPDNFTRFFGGDYTGAIWGHGGSVKDPYDALRLYQSSSQDLPGVNGANYAQWSNAEYDQIVDQVFTTPMDDQDQLVDLYRQAMEIWLPELPDIQLAQNIHYILMNTTYWTGWPSDEDNYAPDHSGANTWPLVLMNLEPVE